MTSLSVCCCACVRDVNSATSDATNVHGGDDSGEAAEGDGIGAYESLDDESSPNVVSCCCDG